MQNIDIDEENIGEVLVEVYQKVKDYNLSDLVNTNKIQVEGHVKTEENGSEIKYNVFYTFKFVHQEGEAEEIG